MMKKFLFMLLCVCSPAFAAGNGLITKPSKYSFAETAEQTFNKQFHNVKIFNGAVSCGQTAFHNFALRQIRSFHLKRAKRSKFGSLAAVAPAHVAPSANIPAQN